MDMDSLTWVDEIIWITMDSLTWVDEIIWITLVFLLHHDVKFDTMVIVAKWMNTYGPKNFLSKKISSWRKCGV
jgi:hypothetical protein